MIHSTMSFLYNKKTRKVFKWAWIVLAVLISLSMVGTLFLF